MATKTTAFTGPVVVGLNDKKGEIRLTDGKNVNEAKHLSIAAPDTITSNTTLTFPDGAGTNGQVLTTDGNGGLSWTTSGGGAGNPGGTVGQTQVNDGAGGFAGISEGTSGQVLTSNGAGSAPTFQNATGGGIAAVVDDTSPELGGNLDLNSNDITGTGNIDNDGTITTEGLTVEPDSTSVVAPLKLNGAFPTGLRNVAIGNQAFENVTDGSDNVLIGEEAGTEITSGTQNTAVGSKAIKTATTAGGNTAVGREALTLCNANNNTAIGNEAMINSTTGISNTALGASAGTGITSGSDNNVFIGASAGNTLTSGDNNIIVGRSAQPSAASVSNEITLGDANITSLRIPGLQSGASTNDVLTFNGTDITLAAQLVAPDPVTSSLDIGSTKTIKLDAPFPNGTRNSFLGENAGASITTGDSNIGIGEDALTNNATGNENIAIGRSALDSPTGSSSNIAIGGNAAASTSGSNNVCIGSGVAANMSGFSENNVIIGRAAANGSGSGMAQSVVIGDVACLSNTPSTAVVVGANAMSSTTGADNTAVGESAGTGIGTGTNNTCLGHNADPSTNNVSNEITLGNSSVATLRCQVTSITSLSDARDKKDVEDVNVGLDFINDLRPVKFVWDTRDGAKKDIKEVGFIAQELDEVQQKHGIEDHLQLVLKNNPDKLEASQGKLIPILVQAIKDLKKEIDELKKA